MSRRRRRGYGEAIGKLTTAAVIEIRLLWARGCTQADLAERHGLRASTVWAIVHRRTWRHVPASSVEQAHATAIRIAHGDMREVRDAPDPGTGRIQQLDEAGEVVATYECISVACRSTGVDRLAIARELNRRGRGWRYEPGEPPPEDLLPWGDVVEHRRSTKE